MALYALYRAPGDWRDKVIRKVTRSPYSHAELLGLSAGLVNPHILTRASGYKAAGVTDPVLRIRAGDNVIHMPTPDQMIELVSGAMTWVEQVMAASWAMKDGTAPFEAGIPDDYTNDTYWPDTGSLT